MKSLEKNMQFSTQCVFCSTTNGCNVYYVACGSESIYKPQEKNHIVPTTGDWVNKTIVERIKDDVQIWKVVLCKECQHKTYKDYLERRIKHAKTWIGYGGMAFLASIFFIMFERRIWPYRTPFIFCLAIVALIIVGFGCFPFFAIRYFWLSKKLKVIKGSNITPEDLKRSFWGAAENVLDKLQKKNYEKICGSFQLPRFKLPKEYAKEVREKISWLIRSEKERSILEVSESREGLMKSLLEEWRIIAQNSNN